MICRWNFPIEVALKALREYIHKNNAFDSWISCILIHKLKCKCDFQTELTSPSAVNIYLDQCKLQAALRQPFDSGVTICYKNKYDSSTGHVWTHNLQPEGTRLQSPEEEGVCHFSSCKGFQSQCMTDSYGQPVILSGWYVACCVLSESSDVSNKIKWSPNPLL